jgi:hypothetical protein
VVDEDGGQGRPHHYIMFGRLVKVAKVQNRKLDIQHTGALLLE